MTKKEKTQFDKLCDVALERILDYMKHGANDPFGPLFAAADDAQSAAFQYFFNWLYDEKDDYNKAMDNFGNYAEGLRVRMLWDLLWRARAMHVAARNSKTTNYAEAAR